MSDFVWWYGFVCLCVTSGIGVLCLIDRSIEWIIDSFKFRTAFLQWYAQRLRSPTDGTERSTTKGQDPQLLPAKEGE